MKYKLFHATYSKTNSYAIVEDEVREELLKTGSWFVTAIPPDSYFEKQAEKILKEQDENKENQKNVTNERSYNRAANKSGI